jgi:hypothetical protein
MGQDSNDASDEPRSHKPSHLLLLGSLWVPGSH